MEILVAHFGLSPVCFDVTSRIKQDVVSGMLNKVYTVYDLGDPVPKKHKELTIIYSHNGKIITKVFKEGTAAGPMAVELP